jgi:integrase
MSRTLPIYWRDQGGESRAYVDLRRWGGPRMYALKPPGSTRATSDPLIAEHLAMKVITDLEEARRNRERLGLNPQLGVKAYADHHLNAREQSGRYRSRHLEDTALILARAVHFFDEVQPEQLQGSGRRMGSPRNLSEISTPDIRAWLDWLSTIPNRRGGFLGPDTLRRHLTEFGALFRRARSEGLSRDNPVGDLLDRPVPPESPTRHLEPEECALLLEAARTLPREDPSDPFTPLPCAYELLAFLLLTGAREGEARRARVRDLDFAGSTVDIRGSKKGKRSSRSAKRWTEMHPQLREILQPYVRRMGRVGDAPLFTAADGQRPFGSWLRTLDAIALRAGFERGEVRTRRFRVSYATHRATCDGVDMNALRLELGHSSFAMLERVYARAQRRSRRMGPEFQYRIEVWSDLLGDRIHRLGTFAEEIRGREAQERDAVLREFLAAIDGVGYKSAAVLTGVDKAVIQRLRTGASRTVQRKNLERMRAFLRSRGDGRAA